MGVIIFDGVFDGDDVTVEVFINIIYHTGQGCSFATSGWSCNQKHTSRPTTQSGTNPGQSYLLKGHNFGWYETQDQGDISFLSKDRDAEPRHIAVSKTKIGST